MDEDTMLSCSNCSCEVSVDDAVYDSNSSETIYCTDCYRICERCDDIGSTDESWNVVNEEEYWCVRCTDYHAQWCDYCESYHTGGSVYIQDRNANYCENCCDNASYCESCDEYNADGCDSCEPDCGIIHDHDYKPDPIFHALKDDDKLFFGIEIEIENGKGAGWENRSQAAVYTQERLEPIDLAYLKSDGSLSDGFEIVTHPMTHDYYMNNVPELWDTLEQLRTTMNMRSWGTQTCGLHIHVSRAGFKGGAHMHRFLNLIYSNEEFFSLVAGRSSSRWAKFDDVGKSAWQGEHDEQGTRIHKTWRSYREKIENGRNSDRYSAVNTQNAHTLELRIFKGTLKTSRVKALINLAHASVEFTRDLIVQDVIVGALDSHTFMNYIDENASMYPDLVALLNVLVNERQVAI